MIDPASLSSAEVSSTTRPVWLIRGEYLLLFLGIVFGVASVVCRYFIYTDGTVYATLGKNLATGAGLQYCGGIHLFYPPGYPIAIALLYWIFQNAELAAHTVSCLAYIGSILLTARLAWRLHPSPVFTLVSMLLVLSRPYLIFYSSAVMSESLLACVILAGAYCTWILASQNSSSIGIWLLWGFLGGFAYLIRADGLVYWPLQALFLCLIHRNQWRNRWRPALLAAFLFLLVIFPYLLLIKQETQKWQLSTKTSILLEFSRMKMQDGTTRGETRQTSQLSKDGKTFTIDRAKETLSEFILQHPREALARVLWNGKRLYQRNDVVFSWTTIPIAIGLLGILRKRIFSWKSAFLLLHAFPMVILCLFYIDERFILIFIPFFAMPYARVFEWGWEYSQKIIPSPLWKYAMICMVILAGLATIPHSPKISKWFKQFDPSGLPLEHKTLGLWMKHNLPIAPSTRITHRNPWVSFYAEGCHSRTPDLDVKKPEAERIEQLVKWCREMGIEYVVVDERMTLPYMPGLAFLLEETRNHPGFKWLKTVEKPYPKIVLYAVLPSS